MSQSFGALLLLAMPGCPPAEDAASDAQADTDSPGDDTVSGDIADDVDQPDVSGDVTGAVSLAPTEGFMTDPTAIDAVYDVDVAVLGTGESITGKAVVINGTRHTADPGTGMVKLTALPAASPTHGVAFADGHMPRAFAVTYASAEAGLGGGRAYRLMLDPVEAEVSLPPDEAADIDVGQSRLIVPAGAFPATAPLTLRAADVDLAEVAAGRDGTIAQRVMQHLPSTTGAVAMVDDERARMPAVAARMDVDVRDAAGTEQMLAPGTELQYALAIPPLLQPGFALGAIEPLYHYDATANRYEKVGSCVVTGSRCAGTATSAGVVLLFPDDALLYAFGCARAKVLVSRDESVSLTERDVQLRAYVENTLDPIVPETQYATVDGHLELTAVFPYVTQSPSIDMPKYLVVSRGRGSDNVVSHVTSTIQHGVMLRGGDIDIFEACRAIPATEVAIHHASPPVPTEPAQGTEESVENAVAPSSDRTCTAEDAGTWATVHPQSPTCPEGQLVCLTPGTSAQLALAGWSPAVTVTCGAGCQAYGLPGTQNAAPFVVQTYNGGSFPFPSDSFWIEIDAGDPDEATIDFQIDFGGSASQLGVGWHFALILPGGAEMYDSETNTALPSLAMMRASTPFQPFGMLTMEGGATSAPNWSFVAGDTLAYTGPWHESMLPNAAFAPVVLVPPDVTNITLTQPNWVESELRDTYVSVGLVRVPVCEEVAP